MASLSGKIESKTSVQRRAIFQALFDDVVLPQRTRLRQFRAVTGQSSYVDDDGYLSELIAAVVTGVGGTTRRGVTRSSGDLADGTEVKKGYRLDPNVDFIVSGVYRSGKVPYIEVTQLPLDIYRPPVLAQINYNACTVQVLRKSGAKTIGCALTRTRSRNSLTLPTRSAPGALLLGQPFDDSQVSDGDSVLICLRQEGGHFNFGKLTRRQLAATLASRPVLVHFHHDPRGRMQVAVLRCEASAARRTALLNAIYGVKQSDVRKQYQPRLIPDSRRGELAPSSTHSVAYELDARLLALGTETANGFAINHWDPDGRKNVTAFAPIFRRMAPESECPDFYAPDRKFATGSKKVRCQAVAQEFFDECMDGYYQSLKPYCLLTSTSRNIGFGNLAQHLVSAVSDIKGTLSGARGADLLEFRAGNWVPSEVKLATGQPGDAMETEDYPRLTLGWGYETMLTWRLLFAVRIVDRGAGLEALVHEPTAATMKTFRSQVIEYFDGRVRSSSGGLQYHATDPYPHDSYGPAERRLTFKRRAQFASGKPATFR